MSIELTVLVRLPDGSHQYLPICTYQGERAQPAIQNFDSKREALNWAEFCLPERLRLSYCLWGSYQP